jgi:hypothetical protein
MNAAKAIAHCLGTSRTRSDGEVVTWAVYDCDGLCHWISWKDGVPSFQSERKDPFSVMFEPYRVNKASDTNTSCLNSRRARAAVQNPQAGSR